MTKEIFFTILIAIIGAASKSIFDLLIKQYLANKKTVNSYIFKGLLILFRYIIPVTYLIYVLTNSEDLNKSFLIKVILICSVIFFNILIDIFSYFFRLIKANQEDNLGLIKSLIESNGHQIDLSDKIIEHENEILSVLEKKLKN